MSSVGRMECAQEQSIYTQQVYLPLCHLNITQPSQCFLNIEFPWTQISGVPDTPGDHTVHSNPSCFDGRKMRCHSQKCEWLRSSSCSFLPLVLSMLTQQLSEGEAALCFSFRSFLTFQGADECRTWRCRCQELS